MSLVRRTLQCLLDFIQQLMLQVSIVFINSLVCLLIPERLTVLILVLVIILICSKALIQGWHYVVALFGSIFIGEIKIEKTNDYYIRIMFTELLYKSKHTCNYSLLLVWYYLILSWIWEKYGYHLFHFHFILCTLDILLLTLQLHSNIG